MADEKEKAPQTESRPEVDGDRGDPSPSGGEVRTNLSEGAKSYVTPLVVSPDAVLPTGGIDKVETAPAGDAGSAKPTGDAPGDAPSSGTGPSSEE